MALFDKVLGKDDREKKLRQEINSLELRKESVFTAINGEISQLQSARTNVLLQAGTAAYDAWSNSQAQADLTGFWSQIQDLEKAIAEQEAKRKEMGTKYDEEIKLINSNLGVSVGGSSARCPKCGAAISQGDGFCQNCGAPLS